MKIFHWLYNLFAMTALAGLSLFPAGTLLGQPKALEDFIAIDTIMLIDVPSFDYQTAVMFVNGEGSYLFPSSQQESRGFTQIYRFDHRTGMQSTITLVLPADFIIDNAHELKDFAVSEGFLVLAGSEYMLVYEMRGEGEPPQLLHKMALAVPYESVRILGDSCLVSVCGYFGSIMTKENTRIGMVDLMSGTFRWEKILPDPEGTPFTFFKPRSVIDGSPEAILLSDISRYDIRLLEAASGDVVSLRRIPSRWAGMGDRSYKRVLPKPGELYHPKLLIDSLRSFKDGISMIRRADFLNDSTLLVAWQPNRTVDLVSATTRVNVTLFDIWRKMGSEWDIVGEDLETTPLRPEDTFMQAKRWPLTYEYVCGDSYILAMELIPVTVYGDKTLADIGREAQEYYLNRDFKCSLLLFKLK